MMMAIQALDDFIYIEYTEVQIVISKAMFKVEGYIWT